MVPDIVSEGLDILFVGYNPGIRSAGTGHHFAGPGNLFWALLADSGLTDCRLTPEQDHLLLYWRIGITNAVERGTPGSGDLSRAELEAGGAVVRDKVRRLRPRIVCLLGKDVYRAYAGQRPGWPVAWGLQSAAVAAPARDFVAPNPSRRSTLPYGVRLRYFRELQGVVAWGPGKAPTGDLMPVRDGTR